MKILVTGGLGYIGSHTCTLLSAANHDVVIVDNLINSKLEILDQLQMINNVQYKFYKIDLCDIAALDYVFSENKFDAVIHFAGLKSVGESVVRPIDYYRNNLNGTTNLLSVMEKYACRKLVFSSSATVYGDKNSAPMLETFERSTTNPYGATKRQIEEILEDVAKSNELWSIALLRYFNPVGAHPTHLIGETPNGFPNNLMPYITKVAVGELEELRIFGNDYPTQDGTGVRDYIHVMDLSEGHMAALNFIMLNQGIESFNLGTGHGTSVLEMVNAFEKISGVRIPHRFVERRLGDIDICFASVDKANRLLKWHASRTIDQMCLDQWEYQRKSACQK